MRMNLRASLFSGRIDTRALPIYSQKGQCSPKSWCLIIGLSPVPGRTRQPQGLCFSITKGRVLQSRIKTFDNVMCDLKV